MKLFIQTGKPDTVVMMVDSVSEGACGVTVETQPTQHELATPVTPTSSAEEGTSNTQVVVAGSVFIKKLK